MSSTDDTDAPQDVRPFSSYTPADHARVAMASQAWTTLEAALRAVVPEAHRAADPISPTSPAELIQAARRVQSCAETLLRAAVVASHEQGLTWTQIGHGLTVTKQSAHERFAEAVTAFRREVAECQRQLAESDETPRSPSARAGVVDTAWYAPRIDAWRAELGRLPGAMTPPGQPGELLARLSEAETAITRLNGAWARPIDAPAPHCPFTAEEAQNENAEMGDYLACTLAEGHPGRHQLAVSNRYD